CLADERAGRGRGARPPRPLDAWDLAGSNAVGYQLTQHVGSPPEVLQRWADRPRPRPRTRARRPPRGWRARWGGGREGEGETRARPRPREPHQAAYGGSGREHHGSQARVRERLVQGSA